TPARRRKSRREIPGRSGRPDGGFFVSSFTRSGRRGSVRRRGRVELLRPVAELADRPVRLAQRRARLVALVLPDREVLLDRERLVVHVRLQQRARLFLAAAVLLADH